MKLVAYEVETINKLLTYLSNQPYGEVTELIESVKAGKSVEMNEEVDPVMPGGQKNGKTKTPKQRKSKGKGK